MEMVTRPTNDPANATHMKAGFRSRRHSNAGNWRTEIGPPCPTLEAEVSPTLWVSEILVSLTYFAAETDSKGSLLFLSTSLF